MKWEGEEGSANVEDRRGQGGRGFGGLPIGGRGIGLGMVAIALVASLVFGVNPLTVLSLLGGGGGPGVQVSQEPAQAPPANDPQAQFVSVVLRSTEQVWEQVFRQGQAQYQPPRLVLFRGATPTACGTGQSAMGPFYCPGDQQVYIDLDFFDTLKQRLGAPGDFAQAYVIAHEVGHHVQNLLGISEKVEAARRSGNERQANAMSVRLELQADCFAGVWGNRSQQAKQWLDQGDVEEALNAAAKIGDDTLQKRSRGVVVPESFTHGSSAQRMQWFKRGFQSGQVADCNTFEGAG
ncbi:MAG TPA: neutral zinc metallopeptidase [Methylibium sp.]|uniref:KPN_02809 family neutral zinc metallopeptidase n=1 Tax=Methylibium sp. TaxID=2067992 RepID=UPI002DBCC541|nr:neutral zinc metallopeptidase [Methylibium sp.]HEU4459869.1 neutral zinc metallopeptidase [Methylibium sp.]